jgi:signal transduction histidine kinase
VKEPTVAGTADRVAVRLRPDAAEIRLGERALAVTRVLLSLAALVVFYVLPPGQTDSVQTLLLLYALYAVILMLALLGPASVPSWLPAAAQTVDVAFVAALALFPIAGAVPFFSFLLFPLFTAGSRWGFQEVMITTIIIEAVIVGDTLLDRQMLYTAFLPRVVAILASGAAIGYLAEQQLRRRFEDRALAVVLGRARLGGTLGDTVNLVLASMRHAFHSRQVIAAFQERPSGRVLLWRADVSDGDALAARPVQVPTARHGDFWFEAPGAAWHAWVRPLSRSRIFRTVAIDAQGRRLPRAKLEIPEGFLAAHSCRRLIGTTLQLGDDWVCRLFVLDPGMGVHREQMARFVLKLAQTVGPALYNNYLVRSLRTRAQALERSRIAREMHDGVTQSLLGLEMEIAVLRRRAKAEAPALNEDLTRVHSIVRDEVVTVRELMEGIRVDDVGSGDLVQHLSGVVDRFSRYTGIAARFVSDGKPVPVGPHARRQIARIIHEALVNVRKHSGADRVLVRADVDGTFWRVSIEDDGRGFPFAGRLTQEELDAQRKGPRTIGERARIIGGHVTVESRPGFGSRVEVEVPLATGS